MALSKWFLCGAEGAFEKDEALALTFAEKVRGLVCCVHLAAHVYAWITSCVCFCLNRFSELTNCVTAFLRM